MVASRSSAIPSSMRTAEARVVLSNGKYRRFARNVIWPASACSIPATPRISISGGPSRRHPSFCAISASFMERLLNYLCGCLRVSHRPKREVQRDPWSLLVEKARLRSCGRSGGRLAARDAHDTKNGHFRERGTRDKDTVRGRVQVRRGDLQTIIQQRQQVVRHYALQGFAIAVTQLYPQTVEFGPAQKRLALGLEVVGKLAHEIDGSYPHQGEFHVFPLRR